ncbi:MAG: DEAD/DEAH box helicase family protein [Paludibacteraceae bacterium]|nr:DEAD/DEAH box helicase family protein [Paludibacteraceae bacterium]
MAQFNMLAFQQNAVEELTTQFKAIWYANNDFKHEIVFKSPTGSGKTFMVSNFINGLHTQPDWNEDVAFVWITFSDDLAMQSKEKFFEYFHPNIGNQLLTVQDFNQGLLKRNDILFLNWQKLSTEKADKRVLRRPEDERLYKETGFYFEDIVENTHKEGRRIIMIIDESHKNVTDLAIKVVIDPLNPKIILKVSATPESEPSISDIRHNRAGFVEVEREDVIAAGLIKEEIISQTEEDLNVFENIDHDYLLLDLAMEKRAALKAEWEQIGKNINPLVLIQLPDDDKKTKDLGIKLKEEIVTEYLLKKGVPANHIAKWFDNKKENIEYISDGNNPVEYMLFKYAAGTGWDCPRAHILVMYREVKSDTFRTQTLGRILRMAIPGLDLSGHPALKTGYLYTNYRRNEVQNPKDSTENRPKTAISKLIPEYQATQALQDFGTNLAGTLFDAKLNDIAHLTQVKQIVPAVVQKAQETAKKIQEIIQQETDYHYQRAQIEEQKHLLQQAVEDEIPSFIEEIEEGEQKQQVIEDISRQIAQLASSVAGVREQDLVIDPILKSDFQSRGDYGDIGRASDFQSSFIKTFNRYFGSSEEKLQSLAEQQDMLRSKGIDPDDRYERSVMADAHFYNYDADINNEYGRDVMVEVSKNDVEKLFSYRCYEILQEQTEDDAKLGNIARSWAPLKEALRQWFSIGMSNYSYISQYKIFLKDIDRKENSVFRRVITMALREYIPTRDALVRKKMERIAEQEAEVFTIKAQYAYTDDMKEFQPSSLSIVKPFRLLESYSGRDNEVKFIKFLESNPQHIEWWFKNGTGKDAFGIRYTDSSTNKVRIFYPDWIIKFKGANQLGIFDTKGGFTANESEVKDKAEALAAKIGALNNNNDKQYMYYGGIVIFQEGLWLFNDNAEYTMYSKDKSLWKNFLDLFN